MRSYIDLVETSLTEALNTSAIYNEADAAVSEIVTPLKRYDIVFQYIDSVRDPIREALAAIVARHEDPAHKVRLVIDLDKRGNNGLGRFVNMDAGGTDELWLCLELFAIFDIEGEQWEAYDAVVDTQPIIHMVAHVFAHEWLHYLQHLPTLGKGRVRTTVSTRVRKAGQPDDYRSRGNEVQAHAQDAARELQTAFGPTAIDHLRSTEGIKQAIAASPALKGYANLRTRSGGQTLFRQFLRHLFLQLRDAAS